MKNGMIIDEQGNKKWYINDLLHREDGSAVERNDGTKHWFINDKRISYFKRLVLRFFGGLK